MAQLMAGAKAHAMEATPAPADGEPLHGGQVLSSGPIPAMDQADIPQGDSTSVTAQADEALTLGSPSVETQVYVPHAVRPLDPLQKEIKARYGLRPRQYGGMFAGGEKVELTFLDAVHSVTEQLNKSAEKRKLPFRFRDAEVAVNVLAEGAIHIVSVDDDTYEGSHSGFGSFGIDTFVDRLSSLVPWMSEDLRQWAEDSGNHEVRRNEKHQEVHSLRVRNLSQGVEANAVMFADARRWFSADCAKAGIDVAHLADEAWFFWSSLYYNAGEGTGRSQLRRHGVDYWKEPWKGAEPDTNRSARFNAAWRVATWDYLRRLLGDDLKRAANEKLLPQFRNAKLKPAPANASEVAHDSSQIETPAHP